MSRTLRLLVLLPASLAGLLTVRAIVHRLRPVRLRPIGESTPPIGPAQVRAGMRRLVLSDLHLGAGDRLDDFTADDALTALLHYYTAERVPTELILAGDTFEFLQVCLPDLSDLEWSPRAAARRLDAILQAHAGPVAALRAFLAQGDNQVTVIVGNHDFELHYASAKQTLRQALGLAPDDPRLRFGIQYEGDGIYLVHGNQYDRWNRFVYFDGICEPFEVVLGTRLIREAINHLEDEPSAVATLIDNVKPLSALLWYALSLPGLRDRATRRLAVRGLVLLCQVLLRMQTYTMANDAPSHTSTQTRLHWKPAFRQVTMVMTVLARVAGRQRAAAGNHQRTAFQREAEHQLHHSMRAFRNRTIRGMVHVARDPRRRNISLFVCGHTHLAQIVPIARGQTYVNTGTWTDVIADMAASRRHEQRFPFLEITYPAPGTPPVWQLLVWENANQRPQPWSAGQESMFAEVEYPV
ncbi:MAG: metallophosphoesterase [Chloroflexi bacterium]|nr:metallophosphoesterase [Chloroflexota bacterium]